MGTAYKVLRCGDSKMFSPRCTYENLQGNQTDGTDGILFFRISEGRLTFLTYLLTYLLTLGKISANTACI